MSNKEQVGMSTITQVLSKKIDDALILAFVALDRGDFKTYEEAYQEVVRSKALLKALSSYLEVEYRKVVPLQ